ncbi:thymic stromal lymphopoietin [Tamandua tetradactyla]|uniref:thymic stromal lymphopoietin n=1 Tax=Tamandua tetradactyla TaxID=48850 RepID=UPI0040537BC7
MISEDEAHQTFINLFQPPTIFAPRVLASIAPLMVSRVSTREACTHLPKHLSFFRGIFILQLIGLALTYNFSDCSFEKIREEYDKIIYQDLHGYMKQIKSTKYVRLDHCKDWVSRMMSAATFSKESPGDGGGGGIPRCAEPGEEISFGMERDSARARPLAGMAIREVGPGNCVRGPRDPEPPRSAPPLGSLLGPDAWSNQRLCPASFLNGIYFFFPSSLRLRSEILATPFLPSSVGSFSLSSTVTSAFPISNHLYCGSELLPKFLPTSPLALFFLSLSLSLSFFFFFFFLAFSPFLIIFAVCEQPDCLSNIVRVTFNLTHDCTSLAEEIAAKTTATLTQHCPDYPGSQINNSQMVKKRMRREVTTNQCQWHVCNLVGLWRRFSRISPKQKKSS